MKKLLAIILLLCAWNVSADTVDYNVCQITNYPSPNGIEIIYYCKIDDAPFSILDQRAASEACSSHMVTAEEGATITCYGVALNVSEDLESPPSPEVVKLVPFVPTTPAIEIKRAN